MPGREHQTTSGSALPGVPVGGVPARIVGLLRRSGMTVDELAAALELTGNAVRAHLARLERDGIVMRASMRRGLSRPAVVYGITAEAECALSRAYVPVLTQLLHLLARKLQPAGLGALMRQVGRGLVAGRSAA